MDLNYPKYHQMGVDTRLAEDQNARREALNQSVIANQRQSGLTSDQDYKAKLLKYKTDQGTLLKAQGDAYSNEIYSDLKNLDIPSAKVFFMYLGNKYPGIKEKRPELFEVPETDPEFNLFKQEKMNRAERRLGKDSAYDVPPGAPALMEYRNRLPEGHPDIQLINRAIDNMTAEKDPTGRTEKERAENKLREGFPALQALALKDPNEAYSQGWRMNDDGKPFVDVVTKLPEKLKSFYDGMGKRKAVDALLKVGEHVKDATQILDLLADPEVAEALGKAAGQGGLWDNVTGRWKNTARNWFITQGYGKNSKPFEAMIRIGMMTSEKRRAMSGTAVTDSEIKTTRPWISSGGDTFEVMLQKMELSRSEGMEIFDRTLDVYKDSVNMSPFYKAFGKERFGGKDAQSIMDKYELSN